MEAPEGVVSKARQRVSQPPNQCFQFGILSLGVRVRHPLQLPKHVESSVHDLWVSSGLALGPGDNRVTVSVDRVARVAWIEVVAVHG